MEWILKSFEQLDTPELYRILQVRNAVFVTEQHCPYQDADNKDLQALHLWQQTDDDVVKAYCRLLPPGVSYPEASIGRVLTSMAYRKEGLGRRMMEQAIQCIGQQWPGASIRISAQLYLEDFYRSLCFQPVGEPYPEDDIPHIEMLLRI